MKRLFTFFAALLFSLGANAQFVNGQVLTAPALNAAIAGPNITSGTINGATIGAVTASTGRFTGLNATSIGATTPGTGVFTTLSASTPVGVTSGGTGLGTLTNHGVLVGAGTSNITQLGVAITGQMLVGVTGADPAFGNTVSTLTATGTITPSSTNGIVGTTTNDNANTGSVGEYINSTTITPGISLSTGTPANITSISLTAGDWDVWGHLAPSPAGGTTITQIRANISTTSATIGSYGDPGSVLLSSTLPAGSANIASIIPIRLSLASTTTVFLVGQVAFGGSTCTAFGFITARRRR